MRRHQLRQRGFRMEAPKKEEAVTETVIEPAKETIIAKVKRAVKKAKK